MSAPGYAAVPSLTPSVGGPEESDPQHVPQMLARATAARHVGTVLKGKWRIERLLGFGGMAYVFAARHRNGRRVAIKCMRPELMIEPSLVQRFMREGYVANKIEHPGAVAILDDDVMDDGTPFLVMELLEGRTLRQRLGDGPLQLHDALDATAAVLDVLAAAHDKGIVHRDLKPDNLFQTEDGAIKVLDFGIARLREQTRSQYETQSGMALGTVGFMPPEQARGLTDQVDARTDVWAIGATLFTLLTGRPVHEAQTVNEALLLAMTTPVPPMASVLPQLPRSVKALLDVALAFESADRYPSARAMKSALDAARASLGKMELLAAVAPPAPRELPALTEFSPAYASATVVARAFARRGSQPPHETSPSWLRFALVAGVMVFVIAAIAAATAAAPREVTSSSSAPPRSEAFGDAQPSAVTVEVAVTAPAAAVETAKPQPTSPSAPSPPRPARAARTAKTSAPALPAASQAAPADLGDPLGVRR